MTTMLIFLGAVVALIMVAFLAVGLRDRRRLSSPEDSAAAREATRTQERYAADRHGSQGDGRQRGQTSAN
ncbi:hypothetical protein OG470_00425 [Micromonospora sp. NBC_00389]|uniref:hypothetical protein n=1 Tax=Micromonospora sp. NBC_00389 TaxID=2903586 RepID=UPI002E1D76E9